MLTFNNKVITRNDKWLDPPSPIYYVYTSGNNGVVVATPSSGRSGTEVTLTNTPASGYTLYSYSVTGATLKNDNQFDIDSSDVYVHGNFIDPYDPSTIPPNTIRVRTQYGERPIKDYGNAQYERATLVPGTDDLYDVYKSGTSFFQILFNSYNVTEIIGANTTGITNMNSMLGGLPLITEVPLFDTSSVTHMQGIFKGCTSLTTVPLFNTSNVTDMESMFEDCSSLTTVPLFNTSNVTDMDLMFRRCSSLTSVPLFDTRKVTTMTGMFAVCTSLTTVPLFVTSNVTAMNSMFSDCTLLTSVPSFDTRKVTNMAYMFDDCTSLTSVPLFSTSKVTSMNQMFYRCSALTSIPLFNTSSVTNMGRMFNGCTNVQSGALALYQQASTQTIPPTYYVDTFKNCGSNTTTGAAELAQIPTSWGGTLST